LLRGRLIRDEKKFSPPSYFAEIGAAKVIAISPQRTVHQFLFRFFEGVPPSVVVVLAGLDPRSPELLNYIFDIPPSYAELEMPRDRSGR
jgi:hypothetical protein